MNILQKQAVKAAVVPDYNWTTIKQELAYVLLQEAASLQTLSNNLPEQVDTLIHKIMATTITTTTGKIIFSGNGKSGLVARKIAATFSGLGIPATFLHPTDALHGDLGMVQPNDLFIVLSKSGSVQELEPVFSFLRNQQNSIVLICCALGISSNKVDLTIQLPLEKEACALNLAPTSSSTLMMAFGDALAIVISKLKGFNKHNFARLHPSGTLGKKLLFTVKDLMTTGNALPLVEPTTPFKDLLFTISSKKLGVAIVVDKQTKLLGIVTDGDLRRACNKGPEVFNKTATDIMTHNPKNIGPTMLALDALAFMEEHKPEITTLVVTETKNVAEPEIKTEAKTVIGLLHIHDIIKAGLQG